MTPADLGYGTSSFAFYIAPLTGTIDTWTIQIGTAINEIILDTMDAGAVSTDYADAFIPGVGGGSAQNSDPGTWTVTTATPEPSSIALLATGLLTAAATLRRRNP